MASENRATSHPLIDDLQQAAYRYDFYAVMRLIECLNDELPRLGASIKASDDAVRLAQLPELEFPASTLASYTERDVHSNKPRLEVNFMGLFGPHGALPLHLTEYARDRLLHHHDPTLSRFADIFHHRMISLFYRAWANARPTVSYDRPDSDRFGFYVSSLMGMAGQAFDNRDALSDRAKRYYVGHFAAQSKSPAGLCAIISDILFVPVSICEFVGEWMDIQPSDQTRLGIASNIATLGESALLGAAVWGCQHKFRIEIGPLCLARYLALLPGGQALAQLTSIVRNYMGDELVWDVQLILKADDVPAELALGKTGHADAVGLNGKAQLGWSMWLGPRHTAEDAKDLMLDPFIAQPV